MSDTDRGRIVRFRVDRGLEGQRLDRAVAARAEGLSVRAAKLLVDLGRVFLDDRRTLKASQPVRGGETVEVHLDRGRPLSLGQESIVWEGKAWLALNKPAGVPVQGTRGQTEGTVISVLEDLLAGEGTRGQGERLRLVHRLDRDTSGLLLVARGEEACRNLETQFLHREVKKRYRVLVHGKPERAVFRVDSPVEHPLGPLGEEQGRRRTARAAVGKDRRADSEAVTEFEVIELFPEYALLNASPLTGRTHQIRIHLAQKGTPVLGDIRYGPRRCADPLARAVPRQMLHAAFLRLRDPDTGDDRQLHVPLPEDMEEVLRRLRAGKRP